MQRTELPPEDLPKTEHERQLPAETAFQRWLFFDGNRWLIVLPLMARIFLSFLLV